jgi:mRNA interferase RelE/StbE
LGKGKEGPRREVGSKPVYTIEIVHSAARSLRAITDKRIQRRIQDGIDSLARIPRPTTARIIKGHDDLYRIRVGDYRVVYLVKDRTITVLVLGVGHRREIYRRL